MEKGTEERCEGASSLALHAQEPLPSPRVSPAPAAPTALTHPSTSGKSRIKVRARSRRFGALGVPGEVGALGVPGAVESLGAPGLVGALGVPGVGGVLGVPSAVGALGAPGGVWARVTGCRSSSDNRNSRHSRDRWPSMRGHSRPAGRMLRKSRQGGKGWSRGPERGRRGVEGDDGVPTVGPGDPAARPRERGMKSQDLATGEQGAVTPYSAPATGRPLPPASSSEGAPLGWVGFPRVRQLASHQRLHILPLSLHPLLRWGRPRFLSLRPEPYSQKRGPGVILPQGGPRPCDLSQPHHVPFACRKS